MAPTEDELRAIARRLRVLLEPYRERFPAGADDETTLALERGPSAEHPRGVYFGGVRLGRRYVSYHLMPVYTHPDLLEPVSPALRKRMQGKSCFNLTTMDETLVAELDLLTREGFERYRSEALA